MGVNHFYQSLTKILEEHQLKNTSSKRYVPTRNVFFVKPHAGIRRTLPVYDILCMDVNNLVYGIARHSKDNAQFLQEMHDQVGNLLRHFVVSGSVYMALDGPGPRAKLILQRERRNARASRRNAQEQNNIHFAVQEKHDSSIDDDDEEEEEEEEEENNEDEEDDNNDFSMENNLDDKSDLQPVASERRKKNPGIDSNQFTSGTALMDDIKEKLCHLSSHVLQNMPSYASTQFHVSGADEAGEGEYKCMWHIVNDFEKQRQSRNWNRRAIVIGSDSDLILFALQAAHLGNIDVLKMDRSRSGTLFHVGIVRTILLSAFPNANNSPEQKQSIIDDFCFLALLSGNDYVPKLNGFDLTKAWSIYVALKNTPEFANERLVQGLAPFPSTATESINTCNMKFMRIILAQSNANPNADTLVMNPRGYLVNIAKNHSDHLHNKIIDPLLHIVVFDVSDTKDNEKECKLLIRDMKDEQRMTLISTATAKTQRLAEFMAADLALTVHQHALRAALDIDDEGVWKEVMEVYLFQREEALSGLGMKYLRNDELDLDYDTTSRWATSADRQRKLDHYLRGIFWTLHYLRCQCCDPNYHYPFRAPNISTVAETKEDIKPVSVPVSRKPFKEMLYPLEFCVAMLPPGYGSQVPVESVGRLLDPDYDSDVKDMFHGRQQELRGVWRREDALTRLRMAIAKELNQSVHQNIYPSMRFQAPVVFQRAPDGTVQQRVSQSSISNDMVRRPYRRSAFGAHQSKNRVHKTTSSVTSRYVSTWLKKPSHRRF